MILLSLPTLNLALQHALRNLGYTRAMQASELVQGLRLAHSADAHALFRLQQIIYHEGSGFVGDGPPSPEALTRRLRSLEPEKTLVLVVGQEKLLAWLELCRLTPKRLEHIAVLTLAVDPEFRRRGIASLLLERAIAWSKEHRIKKISLNVRANNAAAIALYERAGFVLEGRERFHIKLERGYEDNLIMAKYLIEQDMEIAADRPSF